MLQKRRGEKESRDRRKPEKDIILFPMFILGICPSISFLLTISDSYHPVINIDLLAPYELAVLNSLGLTKDVNSIKKKKN